MGVTPGTPALGMALRKGESRANETSLGLGHALKRIKKAAMKGLPKPRHADQVMGPDPLKVGFELPKIGVALTATTREQQIPGTALVGMPNRQHAQHPLPWAWGNRDPPM